MPSAAQAMIATVATSRTIYADLLVELADDPTARPVLDHSHRITRATAAAATRGRSSRSAPARRQRINAGVVSGCGWVTGRR